MARYVYFFESTAETLAYCLLKNHFHFLVRIRTLEEIKALDGESDNDNFRIPSQHFSNFLNSYSKAINKAYGRTGSLFENPFGRRLIVDNQHLYRTIAYIHQNPIKHQFAANRREWKWSSYNEVAEGQYNLIKPASLELTFGGVENYLAIEYPSKSFKGINDY